MNLSCTNFGLLNYINGLFQDADKKGLSTIGEEVRLLAQKAKENTLKPEDYEVSKIYSLTEHIYLSEITAYNKVFILREEHLQCLTWEDLLESSSSVQW